MDARNLSGVDIVHDFRKTPWPMPNDCCSRVLASHCLEHVVDLMPVMAEIHRVCKHGAAVFITVPYWQSLGAWQDPTHVRCFNENSFYYFDDRSPLWQSHKPPVFRVKDISYQFTGNIEAILEVKKEDDKPEVEENQASNV